MTDNSSALKGALRSMWPLSNQLLCHFHLAQQEIRWLRGHNIAQDHQKLLFDGFRKVGKRVL
jgi:hypothetical protein